MATTFSNELGLKCPKPTLRLTAIAFKQQPGDIVEVLADCPTFENDVRDWCKRFKVTLLWIKSEGEGDAKRCQIKF